MKKIIYLYILESMAEWEVGYILQAISMESMLKRQNREFVIKTVGTSKNPIQTIGGLTITSDCLLDEIDENNMVALLLPGAESWNSEENNQILEKALSYIDKGILVGAICGATLALADLKVLDKFKHTSNSLDYVTLFSKQYSGKELYVNPPAVVDCNLITASSAGGLLWAKHIIRYLNVFSCDIIESWYNYYSTGDPKHFAKLISQSI
ncbi:glutamine amidotransferase [Clostridium botulinum]|uniref:DJ-1/PfpI family protein n=1 Tax=Clostridium botulinum TaxID=1491 RepID=UPI00035BA69E|nr:DJ-1/PfpI family protein [Clostridium botulinum]AJD28930.1 DJ-1/PfpI family protein [Clostridium botulinum CDC_297]EPS46845.1 DJ-1/PfpI family protein [Clostridium botulinum A1 str. CFSAN002368]MBY6875804.1 DJ-1/PfpI family protein [Clostridium botulinum]MBY6890540.1 DJ-1/PfpI family protein [Clostridium botulinum]MBY6894030.1 DJ-1/PfpI family protein [Clostridium botulinum]